MKTTIQLPCVIYKQIHLPQYVFLICQIYLKKYLQNIMTELTRWKTNKQCIILYRHAASWIECHSLSMCKVLFLKSSILDEIEVYLRNECLFFSVHGIWIAVRNKQIAWTAKRFSCDLFVPHCDSYPMNREKKTLIPYIYNASNKDPFKNSPSKVRNSNFPQKSGTWPYFQTRLFSLTPSAEIVRG